MTEKAFSKGEAISFGWLGTRKNLGFLILALVITIMMCLMPSILSSLTEKTNPALSLTHSLVAFILQIVMGMGIIKVALMIHDGEKPSLETLFSCVPLFFKYLAAELIYTLIVLSGLILFIVPGIIWGIQFSLFKFIIVDKRAGPVQALRLSSRMTRGHKKELLVFYVLLIGLIILGILALLAGALITLPVTMLAAVFVYRKLLLRAEGAGLS